MTVFVFYRNFFRSTHDTVRFSLPLLRTAPEAPSKGMSHYPITSTHNSRYVRCSYRIQRIQMVCRARSLFAANTPGRTVTVFSKPAKSWFSTDTRRTEMHLTAFVGASRSTSDVS